jgi:hypothetical protein
MQIGIKVVLLIIFIILLRYSRLLTMLLAPDISGGYPSQDLSRVSHPLVWRSFLRINERVYLGYDWADG